QAEDGIRDSSVTGVQTCALPILVVFSGKDVRQQEMHLRKMRAQVQVFGLESALFRGFDLVELVIRHRVVEISVGVTQGIEIEDVSRGRGVIERIEVQDVTSKI